MDATASAPQRVPGPGRPSQDRAWRQLESPGSTDRDNAPDRPGLPLPAGRRQDARVQPEGADRHGTDRAGSGQGDIRGRDEPSPRSHPTRPIDLDRRPPPDLPAPPPSNPERADWHSDPDDPSRLRWWDGTEWTTAAYAPRQPDQRACARCGNPLRRKFFGGNAPCQHCATEIEEYLTHWHTRAWRVLTSSGPRGAEWNALWASLRYQRIDESLGRTALREVALSYVERLVTFAFADGEIEHAEFEAFEYAIQELGLHGPLVEDLRRRMHRGRTLSRLRGGDLPVIRTPGLHLDPEEKVHLDLAAMQVRQLARGPKYTEGRLIASNKKLRFVGIDTGTELPWNRVVSVHVEQHMVVIAATSARGGATFEVTDPDYVAAHPHPGPARHPQHPAGSQSRSVATRRRQMRRMRRQPLPGVRPHHPAQPRRRHQRDKSPNSLPRLQPRQGRPHLIGRSSGDDLGVDTESARDANDRHSASAMLRLGSAARRNNRTARATCDESR
jgi:hypothetical protein